MKKVFTIPPDLCFVTTLAQGLWQRADEDPLKLADMTVFLPTRRACRHLRDAFLRVTGAKAALLPRMRPLGDIDDDEMGFTDAFALGDMPPAISAFRRQMLLTKLIHMKEKALPLDLVAVLASSLALFLDQMQTEEKSFDDLENLVPLECAGHWQETLKFLEIITKSWPAILEEEGCLDPAQHRNLVLKALGEAWQKEPPFHSIIAAGSTGSVPAVGKLLDVIAGLPHGEVILPALDLDLDEEAWQEVDETHPQYTMKKWLERASTPRANVALWEGFSSSDAPRVRLLREAMCPAGVTETWRDLTSKEIPAKATKGFEKIELDHHREEADVIALRLRGALEEEGQTAALVTPDRALARRVMESLKRWGIEANDSAGQSLAHEPLGHFLMAILAAASPLASPVDFLALLKHPLMIYGQDRAAILSKARRVEMAVWRGVRPAGGLAQAARIVATEDPELGAWLAGLAKLFDPITRGWGQKKTISDHIEAHLALAEVLAASSDKSGAERLWCGEVGDKAAAWLNEWRAAASDFPDVSFPDYAGLLGELMRGQTTRPRYGMHPRLSILGPLEARLLHHDVIILGGMNENTWPPAPVLDPWLSRPMKTKLSLPTPERRIGLSAHDFVALASAPRVLVTRASRVGGVPTVPSRFLLQLQAVLKSAQQPDLSASQPWRAWAREMDRPEKLTPMPPPEPRPPLDARPKKLSVTEIGTWLRNPYGLYAKHVLDLKKLEDIDADISAADKGSAIHKALEDFMRGASKKWPSNPLERLLEKGREAFAPFKDKPQIEAFWWPRFERLAQRFIEEEERRRQEGYTPLFIEDRGEMKIAGSLMLSGRVDRIDQMPEGGIEIIDYKTGAVPTGAFVFSGFEPQLPLLAMLAAQGGFRGGVSYEAMRLSYWGLKGGKTPDKKTSFEAKAIPSLIEKACAGLEELVHAFAREDMPYRAVPRPIYAPRYDDYAHLARFSEWNRSSGGDS